MVCTVLPQDVAEALSELWHSRDAEAGPLRPVTMPWPHEGPPDGPTSPSSPVLIVDEHQATRGMVRTALELDGYQVLDVPDGDVAWKLINERHPGVVIAHVWMPGLDGLELCRKIKEDNTLQDVKVIVYTVDITTEEQAKQAGCDQYFLMNSPLSGLRDAVSHLYRATGSA